MFFSIEEQKTTNLQKKTVSKQKPHKNNKYNNSVIPTIIENRIESQSNSPIKSKSHKKNISNELTQTTNFSGIMKLAERIQKNNQKTSQENIKKVLISSKKKEKSLSVKEKTEINNEKLVDYCNNNDSFNALPYTKNFKKKKFEEVNACFPLKKIKFSDESSHSVSINLNNHMSQKQQTFISKRKFKINKENDAIQLSQNEQIFANKENINKKINENENISKKNEKNNENIKDENLFRQNFRKKEDREQLNGFSCNQCEKVFYYNNHYLENKYDI